MAPSLQSGEGNQLLSFRTGGVWNGKRSEMMLDIKGTQPSWSYIFSLVLAMAAATVLSYCFAIRTYQVRNFKALPLVRWLILAVYADSWVFVISSTLLQSGIGLSSSDASCDAAIILCLACYLTTKVFIYFFLVEKVYIVQGRHKPRHQDKFYIFNTCGMLIPYLMVMILTFLFRIANRDDQNICRIGLKLVANIPLLAFDIVINIYLTALFLAPLSNLYSFRTPSANQVKLRKIARRTLYGAIGTLLTSIANLTALLIMRGKEPGWICFASCNADIMMSAIILHWVTITDSEDETKSSVSGPPSVRLRSGGAGAASKYGKGTPQNTTLTSGKNAAGIFVGVSNTGDGVTSSCVATNTLYTKDGKRKSSSKAKKETVPKGRIKVTTMTETVQEFEMELDLVAGTGTGTMSGSTAKGSEDSVDERGREKEVGAVSERGVSGSERGFEDVESLRDCGSEVEINRYASKKGGSRWRREGA